MGKRLKMNFHYESSSCVNENQTRHRTAAQPIEFVTKRSTHRSESGKRLVLRLQGFYNRLASLDATPSHSIAVGATEKLFHPVVFHLSSIKASGGAIIPSSKQYRSCNGWFTDDPEPTLSINNLKMQNLGISRSRSRYQSTRFQPGKICFQLGLHARRNLIGTSMSILPDHLQNIFNMRNILKTN